MMEDYVATHGLKVRLVNILNACNKRILDLPTLSDYVEDGRPYVCWAHILGRCTFKGCQLKRGHLPQRAITNSFADKIVAMLTPGIKACTGRRGGEGSLGKRQRTDGNQA